MTGSTVILGCDPGLGQTTGVFLLAETGALAFQCNAAAAYFLVSSLVAANEGPAQVVAAGERFVPGRGAGARGPGAAATRALIADLDDLADWHWRSAAEVKPWATDARLKAAGLLTLCTGMPHAADAARHMLYCATKDCGMPDPLSKDGPAFWKAAT